MPRYKLVCFFLMPLMFCNLFITSLRTGFRTKVLHKKLLDKLKETSNFFVFESPYKISSVPKYSIHLLFIHPESHPRFPHSDSPFGLAISFHSFIIHLPLPGHFLSHILPGPDSSLQPPYRGLYPRCSSLLLSCFISHPEDCILALFLF